MNIPHRLYISSVGISEHLTLALRMAYEALERQVQPTDHICSIAIEQHYCNLRFSVTLSAELITTRKED